MDIRQLRYFLAVLRHGSFSEAAARIRIAQPSLSVRIAQLEQELGCQLLERNARGVRPTVAGVRFEALASDVLERFDEAREQMLREFGEASQAVTLGLPPVLALGLAVPLIQAAPSLRLPIALKIVEGMSGAIMLQLNDKGLDLAVLHNVRPDAFPIVLPLLEEELHAIGPAVALPDAQTLSVAELAALPLVLPTVRNSMRETLEMGAREAGVRLNVVGEIDSLPQLIGLVRRGVGCTVLPPIAIMDQEGFASIPLQSAWSSSIVVGRRAAQLPAVAGLCRLMADIVADLIRAGSWPGARAADTGGWLPGFVVSS